MNAQYWKSLFLLMNLILLINYANECPVKLIRCPTKGKIWKDICPVKGEKLFPALHVCSEQDPLSHLKRLEMRIFDFDRKRLEPRELPWQWHHRCHFFLLWYSFPVPSLKITAPIFLEVFFIQYFTMILVEQFNHHFPDLHNTKTLISLERKKAFQKGKHHFIFWEAFEIFFC